MGLLLFCPPLADASALVVGARLLMGLPLLPVLRGVDGLAVDDRAAAKTVGLLLLGGPRSSLFVGLALFGCDGLADGLGDGLDVGLHEGLALAFAFAFVCLLDSVRRGVGALASEARSLAVSLLVVVRAAVSSPGTQPPFSVESPPGEGAEAALAVSPAARKANKQMTSMSTFIVLDLLPW